MKRSVVLKARKEVCPAKCTVSGDGLSRGVARRASVFTVETRDSDGALIRRGGERVRAFISGPNDTRIVADVRDNTDGTYTLLFTPPLPGNYACLVYVGTSNTRIGNGRQWDFHVESPIPPDPAKCTAIGDGTARAAVGMEAEFTIFAMDARGEPLPHGGDKFSVYIGGPENIRGHVFDRNDGTYTVTYTPHIPGKYAIAIYLGRQHIENGKLYEVSVTERREEEDDALMDYCTTVSNLIDDSKHVRP